jgi:hypothetical protein
MALEGATIVVFLCTDGRHRWFNAGTAEVFRAIK